MNDDDERPFAPPPDPELGRWPRRRILAVARGDLADPQVLAAIRTAELAGAVDPPLAAAVAEGDRRWRQRIARHAGVGPAVSPLELADAYASGAIK